ncbi:TPA: hypothetical protein I6W77_003236 [Vibrio cholerae]|uniref:hypothetical protein n=1 Tax=Vibrio cholerae TaxID=666 RepID=UPI001A1AB647|nr:hypothetical protein [Vibrio cholerae]MCX9673850.1 hypothetical protein [Vibrio cholerae]MCX9680731.1 hypothetical protein [Vibrio cholerae]MCX9686896.1 hypothetical protein [Vibrio cholerae]MCX9722248.1 hypothetical protein [Vibrio cholerae]HAS2609621.1 hypothetical protein [Vibrio cholerae]
MAKRSKYDVDVPAPSEELLGLLTGIKETDVDVQEAMQAVKVWMRKFLSDGELERLEERDPLWSFDNAECTAFFIEWAIRVKPNTGNSLEFLPPVPGANYKPLLRVLNKDDS